VGQILSTGWTLEHSDALKSFVLVDGLSYAQSAAAINAQFGTTYSRNAAIGRANRIGLLVPAKPKRPPAPRKIQKSRQRYSPESKRVLTIFESAEIIKLRCVEIVSLNLTLAELDQATQCHYIAGEDLRYCGHPIIEGSSYCGPHQALTRGQVRVEVSEGERQRRRLHFIKLGGNPAREVMA
jgi:GcrA cell cycle regulator